MNLFNCFIAVGHTDLWEKSKTVEIPIILAGIFEINENKEKSKEALALI